MIHQYKLNGFNIVLDTYSGAVHCVDDLSYDIIALYENTNEEEIIEKMLEKYKDITKKDIEETIEEIEKIKQDGKLFSKDIYEGKNLDLKKRDSVVSTMSACCSYM